MTYVVLGLLIFCAHLFNAWFSSRRIPDVLLLMVIGIIIGPVTGWVAVESMGEVGPVLASLTLLFILFDSGIDMRLSTVRQYWTGVVQVTFSSFVLSMAGVTFFAHYLLLLTWQTSLMLGSMVSGTAAAIVIPLVRQMRVSDKTRVMLTLESAISGILSIVVSLALMEGFKLGNLSVGMMLGNVLASIIMALLVGLVGGILWASFMERVRKLQNSMFLTPAFVFVLYGVSEIMGFSGAIAALTFGLVLGNPRYFGEGIFKRFSLHKMSPLQDREKSFFKEFVFILKTYFFVYIGICIPFNNGLALAYGAMISVVLYGLRFVLVKFVGKNNTAQDKLTVSMMIPKGLVSAVLASMPEQMNHAVGYEMIPGATMVKEITYAVIFFSIICCSVLVLLSSKHLVKEQQELIDNKITENETHEIESI